MSSSKPSFLKTAFILILTVAVSSCNDNEKSEKESNKYVLTTNTEETEAYFFIATASLTKSIISKTKLAQQKSVENSIKLVSAKIENNQNMLLQEVNKIAIHKLIIINEISTTITKKGLYELENKKEVDFDKAYLDSVTKSLSEMIKLLESIATETNDPVILKLVTHYLPSQYDFLRETEKIKRTIN